MCQILNIIVDLIKQIVEEAGGAVSRMDGGKFTVFDRSLLVSNGVLHAKVCFSVTCMKYLILFQKRNLCLSCTIT